MVDLDLDVVLPRAGDLFVDDEDEFAEHRQVYGYPDDVVAAAETSSATVFAAIASNAAPFDGTAERWLGELRKRPRQGSNLRPSD